ncbi:cupredoxin domain-containing protein [Bacillus sp. Bva_UNVM-123]|uniref:cupredoxin domain-containing protein n=1 Tax=Bacillus sp. Bva_UNVM-123 TaxID=2829798 RepID=UPI00391F6705
MFVKKCLTGLAALLAMIVVVNTAGSLSVFAVESGAATQPMETVKDIEVELYDDYFNPKVITISNGRTTKLILKNKGRKEHTFTVEKLGIDVEIQPGKETTITVQPKISGIYELICRYHINEGMTGKVIVKK